MKWILCLFCFQVLWADFQIDDTRSGNGIVKATKRIYFDDYPDAFNPSIIDVPGGYLLSFRYCPDREHNPWLSYIGAVFLDPSFEAKGPPQLLVTRPRTSFVRSQSEDARLFRWNQRIFLIYNDNMELECTSTYDRRDMYVAEVQVRGERCTLSPPLKLVYEEKYNAQLWQKNWVPFEWKRKLLMSYSLHPHEVISPNWHNGSCYRMALSTPLIHWAWGTLRGSTPALLVDGEYLAFFHSSKVLPSKASWGYSIWHYLMGAYTFSKDPPFQIRKISAQPLVADGFYTESSYMKRVIFPGGFVTSGGELYLAYGKDDSEMWIATLDLNALKASLTPVND